MNINNLTINDPNNSSDLILGFFDGLHIGHQLLFNQATKPFNILTFKNIPNKKNNFLYTEIERKKQLLKNNVNKIFTLDIAINNMTAEYFGLVWLPTLTKFKNLIVGSDYQFGSDRKDINFLQSLFKNVIVVDRSNVSTSNIKKFLLENDFLKANKFLLEPYYRCGKVVYGNKNGKKIGFPTANLLINPALISLSEGSYATKVLIDEKEYPSVSFVGKSKTISQKKSFIESHVIGFNNNLYDKDIKVSFYKFLRKNTKFESIELLKNAIKNDINTTINFFNNG